MKATLSFIQLTVEDVGRSVVWYRDVLGLVELMTDQDRFALLEAGSTRVALRHGVPQPGSVLLSFEVIELDDWERNLEARGVRTEGPCKTSPEGYRRLRLRDPDGYALSLFEWLSKQGGGLTEIVSPRRKGD